MAKTAKPWWDCPLCDCMMPYKERKEHVCNIHSIERKAELQKYFREFDKNKEEACLKGCYC